MEGTNRSLNVMIPADMDELKLSKGERTGFVLEQDSRLSESFLWKLQRKFFDQGGVKAWTEGAVPHYVTDNAFIAEAYAKVVFGFLRDCSLKSNAGGDAGFQPLDPSQPVYIIELGAGSGRFAFHFLKKLIGILSCSMLNDISFEYVMTDFTPRNLEHWQAHPSLQPFVEQNVLDFALFDAEHSQQIELKRSGDILSADTIKNPIVVLANYFFDSIPQDVFFIENGTLYESLVTVSSSQQEPDADDPDLLNRIDVSYANNPISSEYYDDPDLDHILKYYQQRLASTFILFPNAAIKCARQMRALSKGRMLLLSADKGYVNEESLLDRAEPAIVVHGSFSMMVNYDAISRYFRNEGGQALQTMHRPANINICAFLFGNHPNKYIETRQFYKEAIENGGPDDFFTLKKGIEKHYEDMSLEELIALLRLSGWDSKIFIESFSVLLEQVESARKPWRQELHRGIQLVWDNYYHIGEAGDIAFYIAMLLYGMKHYLEALTFFDHSLRLYGPDAGTLYNMAMCHYSLRQLDQAIECVNQTLEFDPAFDAAKTMRIKIQSEMAGQTL